MTMFTSQYNNHNVFWLCREVNNAIGRDVRRFAQQFLIALVTFAPGWNLRERQRRMLPEVLLNRFFVIPSRAMISASSVPSATNGVPPPKLPTSR